MDVIRCRRCENRIPSLFWCLDSTHKLAKCKFAVISAVKGCSRCIMHLKYSNNKKVINAYELLKEAMYKNITLLQVCGGKGSENRLI